MGTLAGGLGSSRETVVSVLPTLISKAHNVIPINFSGVGADDTYYDRFWGGVSCCVAGSARELTITGVCGWGTRRNVVNAYRSWAARYLSLILSVVGLPVHGDNEFFHALYKECKKNPEFEAPITQVVLSYERHTDVEVEAQCCFDTVGSLGLPLFGLARPLAFLRRGKSKDSSVSTVPNIGSTDVKYSFHALSLHETREPFSPTYMTGENVHQVFFLGNHSDLGWIVVGQETFVHAVLAWMIQQLHSHSKIKFDDDKLKRYFNSYRPNLVPTSGGSGGTTTPLAYYPWATGHPTRTSPAVLAIIGKKVRKPWKLALGRRALEGGPDGSESPRISACAVQNIPEIQIHIGARESTEENVVPGYTLKAPIKGQPYWARCGSRKNNRDCVRIQEPSEPSRLASLPGSETASSHEQAHDHMYEAPVGHLEALLLGLPAELVSTEPCCKGLSERI
ncbi:hypothetical protein LB507_004237 [Fusarium sp. FIESC RH6]|nr:hypothetical protein LB507_004237 [Fusarium sp. FIESC RH6]